MRHRILIDAVRDGVVIFKAASLAVPAVTTIICWAIGWQTVKAYEVFIIASICMLTFGLFGVYLRANLESSREHSVDTSAEHRPARRRLHTGADVGFMLLSVVSSSILFAIGWTLLQFA